MLILIELQGFSFFSFDGFESFLLFGVLKNFVDRRCRRDGKHFHNLPDRITCAVST